MKIIFIGTGYVGLVSGVMLAHLGHDIVCLDLDRSKIDQLKSKKSPIFEVGLDDYLQKYANSSRLQFIAEYNAEKIKGARAVFITVGTPSQDNGEADLTGVLAAVRDICSYINEDCYIVIKSTVPPGTCDMVQKLIYDAGYKNEVISNPEFLREGMAIKDFLYPDRIIVGAESERAVQIMREIYEPLISGSLVASPKNLQSFEEVGKSQRAQTQILFSDLKTSELIKYASNSFLANKIAFINEMSDLCEKIGADVALLADGMGSDKRIGRSFLNPGPGFGGSCFPKDILALRHHMRLSGVKGFLLDAVIESNVNRTYVMFDKVNSILNGIKGKKIAALGLAYKAGTDDLRSSPAIALIKLLQSNGAIVFAYDPKAMVHIDDYMDSPLECCSSEIEAAKDVDAVVILTEWPQFKQMDLQKLKSNMKGDVIIDLRNILDADIMRAGGFRYYVIGKKDIV